MLVKINIGDIAKKNNRTLYLLDVDVLSANLKRTSVVD